MIKLYYILLKYMYRLNLPKTCNRLILFKKKMFKLIKNCYLKYQIQFLFNKITLIRSNRQSINVIQ